MSEVFYEKFVKRSSPKINKVLYYVSFVMTIVFALLWLMVAIVNYSMMGIYLLPFLMFIFMTYKLYVDCFTEFDYNYTDGKIEIYRIRGKAKKRLLVETDLSEVVVIAPSKTDPVSPWIGKKMRTFDCTSHEQSVPYYCMITKYKSFEKKILFEPSEEMLREMKRSIPDKVHM